MSGHAALVDFYNFIDQLFDRSAAMGHDHHRLAFEQRPDVAEDRGFGFGVEVAGALVEQNHPLLRIIETEQRLGDGDTLALPSGQVLVVFSGAGLIAILQGHDLVVDAGQSGRADDL